MERDAVDAARDEQSDRRAGRRLVLLRFSGGASNDGHGVVVRRSIDGPGGPEPSQHCRVVSDHFPESSGLGQEPFPLRRQVRHVLDVERFREGVDASYRRDPNGIGRSPAFLFAQPCRADTGPTLRTLRGLEYLRTNDYPIMYEVARRCNWHCVRFELVAYRDVVPTRVRLHVDSMAELSISTGGMMSAALATA